MKIYEGKWNGNASGLFKIILTIFIRVAESLTSKSLSKKRSNIRKLSTTKKKNSNKPLTQKAPKQVKYYKFHLPTNIIISLFSNKTKLIFRNKPNEYLRKIIKIHIARKLFGQMTRFSIFSLLLAPKKTRVKKKIVAIKMK